jgi:demethylmenaquinone methyltransferase/2-methoxy-6-polyprenyl-1,4-benzoquinol methylase
MTNKESVSAYQQKMTDFGYQQIPFQEKTFRVKEVFQSVAKKYDLMNDLMSLGLHRLWKRFMVAKCALQPHHQVLDLAGGTGDLSLQFAQHIDVDKGGMIMLGDINAAMLQEARPKLYDAGIVEAVKIAQMNAESLPFQSNHFDCVAIAFGLRNVTNKEAALKDIYRILKPGGRLVILEFSHPTGSLVKRLYDQYSFSVLPFLGEHLVNDAASYRYLAESIRMHPNQETLKAMLENAGFEKADYQNIHQGVVALHLGFKL